MKNWNTLDADVVRLLNKHYSKGRGGRKIEFVVVHYNAGNLTVDGCWSVWQTREASAHYQVEDDGTIGQLVYDSNTAWHASSWDANCKSIGIEHANMSDGTITEATLDNGAHLVAAVCRYYGLGRPEWLRNVFPHRHFAATSCPGQIYGSQKDAYIARAQYWYDKMAGKNPGKPGSSGSASKPSTDGKTISRLADEVIAGKWGNDPRRTQSLRAAGYDAAAVQAEVNRRYGIGTGGGSSSSSSSPSIDQLARDVIAGKYGNGDERRRRLGSQYAAVQARVNEMLGAGSSSGGRKAVTSSIVDAVIRGDYGNGETRRKRLEAAGYDYDAVQAAVNRRLA